MWRIRATLEAVAQVGGGWVEGVSRWPGFSFRLPGSGLIRPARSPINLAQRTGVSQVREPRPTSYATAALGTGSST